MTVIDPTPSENGTQRVLIDCKEIERVNKFKYLGSLVTVDSAIGNIINYHEIQSIRRCMRVDSSPYVIQSR